MNEKDRKKLRRYKWFLHHPLLWWCLMWSAVIAHFAVVQFVRLESERLQSIFEVFVLVVPFGLLFGIQIWAQRQGEMVLNRLLEQEIAVQKALEVCDSLYTGIDFCKQRNADAFCSYVTDVAPLYLLSGDFDRAIALYRQLLSKEQRKSLPKVARPSVIDRLADCLVEKGDTDGARNVLSELLTPPKKGFARNRRRRLAAMESLTAETRAKLDLKSGNAAPMAALLAGVPVENRTPLEQLCFERLRGWTAYTQGNYDAAMQAYSYVYRHGSGTYYQQEAEYYLNNIRDSK